MVARRSGALATPSTFGLNDRAHPLHDRERSQEDAKTRRRGREREKSESKDPSRLRVFLFIIPIARESGSLILVAATGTRGAELRPAREGLAEDVAVLADAVAPRV